MVNTANWKESQGLNGLRVATAPGLRPPAGTGHASRLPTAAALACLWIADVGAARFWVVSGLDLLLAQTVGQSDPFDVVRQGRCGTR